MSLTANSRRNILILYSNSPPKNNLSGNPLRTPELELVTRQRKLINIVIIDIPSSCHFSCAIPWGSVRIRKRDVDLKIINGWMRSSCPRHFSTPLSEWVLIHLLILVVICFMRRRFNQVERASLIRFLLWSPPSLCPGLGDDERWFCRLSIPGTSELV